MSYRINFIAGFNKDHSLNRFSGRIDNGKGIFFLLDAFADACKKKEDLRLVLIGQGSITECKQKYASINNKMIFTGLLPFEQVMNFYRISDAGVLPSLYEQCPYTVLEMMANKIPMILSEIDGLNEISDDDKCVFIEPVNCENGEISFDIKELLNAMPRLTGDSQTSSRLAANSCNNLINNYSATRMASEIYGICYLISMILMIPNISLRSLPGKRRLLYKEVAVKSITDRC